MAGTRPIAKNTSCTTRPCQSGLAASVLHPGQPLYADGALINVPTSGLSWKLLLSGDFRAWRGTCGTVVAGRVCGASLGATIGVFRDSGLAARTPSRARAGSLSATGLRSASPEPCCVAADCRWLTGRAAHARSATTIEYGPAGASSTGDCISLVTFSVDARNSSGLRGRPSTAVLG